MGKETLMTGVLTSAGQAESSADEQQVADRGNGNAAEDAGGQFTRGVSRQTFWEDQKRRVRRGRLIGFAICIPLWVLSMVPLARESMEGREGVLVYLTVGAISLGVAAVIRGVYVLLTKRPFLSPWIFVMAALVALVGSMVQGAGEVPVADASALESTAA
jgi:hypothetical protein